MAISHGNISHHTHKGKGTKVCAHTHNGGLLLVLASFSKDPGTIDWNGTDLTNKINTGYNEAVPSCDIWYLQSAEQGAYNLTMNNESDNYIYAHICIISVTGASVDADPFGQTDTNSGTGQDSTGTLASCAETSRTYYVTGLNTAGSHYAQTPGAGQTELWDDRNVDNDCSAGYWEDAETAMATNWSGSCAWETATIELKTSAPAGQILWFA